MVDCFVYMFCCFGVAAGFRSLFHVDCWCLLCLLVVLHGGCCGFVVLDYVLTVDAVI